EGKGLIKRVRTGPYTTGILRVVLDLDAPVKSKSFALQPNESYGFRVVVDLAGTTAPRAVVATEPTPIVLPKPATPVEKPIVVAIDAGHGGEDPGARGRRGLLEKDV